MKTTKIMTSVNTWYNKFYIIPTINIGWDYNQLEISFTWVRWDFTIDFITI